MPRVAIKTNGYGPSQVMAEVDGLWAIHPTPMSTGRIDEHQWTLTHVGSGFYFIYAVPLQAVRGCLADLKLSKLDWTLPDGPKSLTAAHKAEGKKLRTRYGQPAQ